ncbi:MAG: 16S rRNA (cytosine(967)-C(5))-methyltransferase RsmB [Gammaproteobacteria bacterium]
MTPRVAATHILTRVLRDHSSLTSALEEGLEAVHEDEHAFVRELCFGVCRHYFYLEAIIKQLLHEPLRAKDQDIHALILIGLYQLIYMKIPDHAAVSSTVETARGLRKQWACNLINAALRKFLRQKKKLMGSTENIEPAHYRHPAWLLHQLKAAWPDHWEKIIEANNTQAPMTLRVNLQKISREDYISQLAELDISAKGLEHSTSAIQLDKPVHVNLLPGFNDGWVSVQDLASQWVPSLMQLSPQARVLDACAAPGGKTGHIFETEPSVRLLAVDHDESRMQKVKDNLHRLRFKADLKTSLLEKVDNWWDQKPFDIILLDAPCSATGVIRRHPDIKILRHSHDIDRLSQQQLHFLHAVWPTLKRGGRLIYTTCSVLPQENNEVIKQFLAQQSEASIHPIELPKGIRQSFGWQSLPEVDGQDGFFYSCIIKRK